MYANAQKADSRGEHNSRIDGWRRKGSDRHEPESSSRHLEAVQREGEGTVGHAHRCFNKETQMNWDRIEGNWKQFKGNVKQQWGKLTDDQLDVIAGKRDQLAGKIQETYGITKDETDKQLSEWLGRQK
jgi:uncharacterized protein YjbJ (UPF0337 family)